MNFSQMPRLWLLTMLVLASAPAALAQTFSSGSTGADGALNLTTPGIIVFDPKKFNPPLDPDGDNIYHFTTINIAAGVTVQLRGDLLTGPVIWLAQGAVQINGMVDLSGQDNLYAASTLQRTVTVPGAGGYAGGYPVASGVGGAGAGPGGGTFCSPYNAPQVGESGVFSGNQFLVPLIGGSGGGAMGPYGGGAGGGAILIASSTSIIGAGSIRATGGNDPTPNYAISGTGSGGAIRLVAPSVTFSGLLNVSGGTPGARCRNGTNDGVIRIEAFQIGSINKLGTLYTATPFGLFLPSTSAGPTLRVVSVGGNPVATLLSGAFTMPDVTVNSNLPLAVSIAATNVPVGTIVTLTIFSENGPDQTIQSTPLAGTLATSTATASVTLPSGFSKGFVKATFAQ